VGGRSVQAAWAGGACGRMAQAGSAGRGCPAARAGGVGSAGGRQAAQGKACQECVCGCRRLKKVRKKSRLHQKIPVCSFVCHIYSAIHNFNPQISDMGRTKLLFTGLGMRGLLELLLADRF
jgi:hypothetical protein